METGLAARMKYEDVIKAWDDQADGANDWTTLGEDEKIEFAMAMARDEIVALRHAVAFYKRRCEELQRWQSAMRDPERTLVCDVLANGETLPPNQANGRYGSMTPSACVGRQACKPEPTNVQAQGDL